MLQSFLFSFLYMTELFGDICAVKLCILHVDRNRNRQKKMVMVLVLLR